MLPPPVGSSHVSAPGHGEHVYPPVPRHPRRGQAPQGEGLPAGARGPVEPPAEWYLLWGPPKFNPSFHRVFGVISISELDRESCVIHATIRPWVVCLPPPPFFANFVSVS